MPGDSENLVTLGALGVRTHALNDLPLYRPATVADLVSALRAEGAKFRIAALAEDWLAGLVDPEQLRSSMEFAQDLLDALAEAQPLPPAGGSDGAS